MTDEQIFKEIWSIEDADVRADRMSQLAEQDTGLAARIRTLLRYSDQCQSVFDDPLIVVKTQTEGQKAARYSIQGELARGGMGVIYTAYDSQMRRNVVLKCLQLKHRDNFQASQRFYNEAHIAGQLQHPGIAPVYELGELEDGRPFYCMKLVEGKTLAQFLSDRCSLVEKKVQSLNFFLQICQTMAFAHERGIIHRDLKPSNIMVGKHGQTLIMDWGVAKSLVANDVSATVAEIKPAQLSRADGTLCLESCVAEEDHAEKDHLDSSDLTRHGQIVGTPGYMPPEQAAGQNALVGKQSDVYALGVMLFEILTRTTPARIDGRSPDEFESASNDRNRLLLDSNADLEMADLARSCLQQKPADRPRDADAVAQVMLAYFASRETAVHAAQIELEKELTRNEEARKRRFLFAICIAACLGLLVAGVAGTTIGFYKEHQARAFADAQAEDARAAKDLAVNAKIVADDSKAKAEARLAQLTKVNEILGAVFENLHPHKSARSGKPLIDLLVKNLDQAAKELEGDSIGAPDVIASFQTKIGNCYHAFGFHEKAVPLFEKVDRFNMAEYGLGHEKTINARCRLADSLVADNQTDRANALYLELQEFHTRSKTTDTQEFFRIQCKLAANYLAMDEKKKALELIETYSKRGLEILGVEYGQHMAQIYNFNHMPDKAIEALNLVLSKMESSEGNVGRVNQSDPDVETAQMLLARSYLRLNQHRKALPILEKLSLDFEARYGNSPCSKSYIVSLSLAKALQGVGRYRDSIKQLNNFLSLTKAKSSCLHAERVFARYWLVEAYLKTGDFSKALGIAIKIYRAEVATHGRGHFKSSLSAEKLADIYLLLNQPSRAKALLDVAFIKNDHDLPEDAEGAPLERKKFKLAMVAANRGERSVANSKLKTSEAFFSNMEDKAFNVYPMFFDGLEPKIWLAESLALEGDKDAIPLIEDFESSIKKRSARLDELISQAQRLHRACVARYVIDPNETLVLRLKELIEILKFEHLEGAQAHLLEEAKSLLGMAYLNLGKTDEAKRQLESSFVALRSILDPSPQTNQAIIDAGKRLAHFYSLNNASEDAKRILDTIKVIEPNTNHTPAFSRALIDRTLTTDSM